MTDASLLLTACGRAGPADLSLVKTLLEKDPMLVHTSRDEKNRSPLHKACAAGSLDIVQVLLDNGHQWNVVDDDYIAAGDLARDNGHAELYEFLINRGVQTEMLIRVLEGMDVDDDEGEDEGEDEEVEAAEEDGEAAAEEAEAAAAPAEEDQTNSGPTKEDEFTLKNPLFINGKLVQPKETPGTGTSLDNYLAAPVKYEDDHGRLLDANGNAIEMEWERVIMEKHAEIIAPVPGLSVMNVGFGMGMVDQALQDRKPCLHTICEAHPVVLARIAQTPFVQKNKDNIRVLEGRWQDTLSQPDLEPFDGIFFDTFSEQYENSLVPFHRDYLPRILRKPDPKNPEDKGGIYSFFNGLASGNVFFHHVACKLAEIDLEEYGFETEWIDWEFGGPEGETKKALGEEEGKNVWKGVRYDYWALGNKYKVPIVRWKKTDA